MCYVPRGYVLRCRAWCRILAHGGLTQGAVMTVRRQRKWRRKEAKPSAPRVTKAEQKAVEKALLAATEPPPPAVDEDQAQLEAQRLFKPGGLAQQSAFGPWPDQAAADDLGLTEQANWVRRTGETPLEFLARVYRNPLVDVKDRISAARSALDFVHKKLPNHSVLGGDPKNPLNTKFQLETARERLIDRIKRLAQGSDTPSG